jgi:DNA-binding response OmpR family regulator
VSTGSSRVLIADDEAHIRELLRSFLAREGYDVVAVATGEQALAAVPNFRPDVVLVDMVMPGICGTDVLIALRRTGATVPVILISAHEVMAGEAFFGVLRKPFSLRAMAEVVAAAVEHGRISSS